MATRECALFGGALELRYELLGDGGDLFLLLHGGFGPASMRGLAGELARDARVLLPTHPGFEGTVRPGWLASVPELALAYLSLLDIVDAPRVVVVGNSLGGWLAAELALRGSPRIRAAALLSSVGIEGDIVDPTSVPPAERFSLSFHDPQRFAPRDAELRVETLRANQRALSAYSGRHYMHDPTLAARLAESKTPTLVMWGESDRIVDVTYGRRLAAAIPGAELRIVPAAGHFPQLERPDVVVPALRELARRAA